MIDLYKYMILFGSKESIIITSFEILEIYFNKKSQEDKERILRDAAFGC